MKTYWILIDDSDIVQDGVPVAIFKCSVCGAYDMQSINKPALFCWRCGAKNGWTVKN